MAEVKVMFELPIKSKFLKLFTVVVVETFISHCVLFMKVMFSNVPKVLSIFANPTHALPEKVLLNPLTLVPDARQPSLPLLLIIELITVCPLPPAEKIPCQLFELAVIILANPVVLPSNMIP